MEVISIKLEEIAKLGKTSVSTVSRVLNNKPGVGKKKREVIEKLLIENGFYNKVYKISQDAKRIALVVPDLKNPFFGEIIKKVIQIGKKKDYEILIFDTDENYENEIDIINSIIKGNILGVIMCVVGGELSKNNIKKLQAFSIPFVLFDRELDFYNDGIFLDDFKAGFLGTEILIKEGYKNIGILVGNLKYKNMENRLKGYKNALEKYNLNINENYIYEIGLEIKDGYKIGKKIFLEENKLEGIFSCSNLITLGLIKYQKEYGEKIPLVAFDNPDYFDILDLNITCVTRSISEIGEQAVNILLRKIKKNTKNSQKIIITPKIILKGSEKL